MTIASRREQVREALREAGFNPRRFKWNEVQRRTGTSAANLMGDEWAGDIESLDWALSHLPDGAVAHVLVYERGEFGELKDVVTVVLQ